MTFRRPLLGLLVASVAAASLGQATRPAAPPPAATPLNTAPTPRTKAEILATMEKMADAQLNLPAYRDRSPVDWVAGAFYVGLARLSHVSDKPQYKAAMLRIADANNWEFKGERNGQRNIAFGDNQTVGQMYIDLALQLNDTSKLENIRKQWDEILAGWDNPTDDLRRAWGNDLKRDGKTLPWWWCDALFMVPPGLTWLSEVTKDPKYLAASDKQYWVTYDLLYDHEEHLFFRDMKYPAQRTPNGKKVFWSRGNGWVVAGTANILLHLPKDHPSRPKYETVFKEMCAKLAEIQQPDGLWRGSLIDPTASPWPETSGTAFFTYGIAWGINNGLLEEAKFRPVIEKSWAALNEHIRPDGLLGYVQAVGERPQPATADNIQAYATGAFLLGGCEMIKLYEKKQP
jgi:rhamnogalacturonyl hydrolase YesR